MYIFMYMQTFCAFVAENLSRKESTKQLNCLIHHSEDWVDVGVQVAALEADLVEEVEDG